MVVNNESTLEFLAKQRREMELDGHSLYIGLSSKLHWIWLDGETCLTDIVCEVQDNQTETVDVERY